MSTTDQPYDRITDEQALAYPEQVSWPRYRQARLKDLLKTYPDVQRENPEGLARQVEVWRGDYRVKVLTAAEHNIVPADYAFASLSEKDRETVAYYLEKYPNRFRAIQKLRSSAAVASAASAEGTS